MRTTRLTLTLATLSTLVLAGPAGANTWTTSNWTQGIAGDYNWGDTANWDANGVPDGSADAASFTSNTGFLATGAFNLNVGSPITLAALYSNKTTGVNSSAAITLSGSDITFNNTTTNNAGNNNYDRPLIQVLSQAPSLIINNNVTNLDSLPMTFSGYGSLKVNGAITSATGIAVPVGGVWLGSASNSISGVTLSGGQSASLVAANTGAFGGITGTLSFAAAWGGNLITAVTGTTTFGAALDLGDSTYTASNQTGAISFNSFGSGSVLDITTNSIINTGGTGNININRAANASGVGSTKFSGTGFTIAKNVVGGVNTAGLEFAPASGTQTWSGNITGFGGSSVTKSGNGTVILSGSNNYSVQTHITGGTLLVNGTNSSPGGGMNNVATGNFQVESGATLGGTGRIAVSTTNIGSTSNNAILVTSGGTLSPGSNGIGTITLDATGFQPVSGSGVNHYLNMASGAAFNFDLDGSGGTPDQIALWSYRNSGNRSDLFLNSNALNLDLVGTQTPGTYTVNLINFYSDSGLTATASGLSSGLSLGTLGAGIESASILYNTDSIGLQYTVAAIPEPASLALLAVGGLLMVPRKRRP